MVLFKFLARRLGGRGSRGGTAAPISARLATVALGHRRLVLLVLLLVAAAGALAALALPSHLANSFAVPQTESAQAQQLLGRVFGEQPEGTFTVLFRVRHSSDQAQQARLRTRLEQAARTLPGGHLTSLRVGGGVVYGDLATTLTLQQAKGQTTPLRQLLRTQAGPRALVTGIPAVQHDLDPVLAQDLERGYGLALPLALLALALALGLSFALAVPFLFALGSVGGALALLYPLARLFPVTTYAVNVIELVGLGLAVDYSLLMVCRYREELGPSARPSLKQRESAALRTMATAGRAVVFSALAVAVGLSLLLLVPVPFIRTLGLAGLLVPLLSLAAALTLQPILLTLLVRARPARRSPIASLWTRLVPALMRRPVLVLLPATALLLAAATPALFLHVGPGSLASLPTQTEAAQGLKQMSRSFGPGALTPSQIVIDSGQAGGARGAQTRAYVDRLSERIFHDAEAYVVASGPQLPYTSADGRYTRVYVIGRHEYGSAPSRRLVERLRSYVPAANPPPSTLVRVGGPPAQGADFLARAYGHFGWLVLAAILLTYLVLVRSFRSLLLPLKAVLLNALTVAASYGLLVLVFHYGVGAGLLGVTRSDQIDGWVPLFLLATLFGLSMDYEVFLVSRMREAWDRGASNTAAVTEGLERTGRLITVAALVMAVSFTGFIVGSVPALQQFGLGLAFAVLLDATLVRTLLVPSLMALLGRFNWWLPSRRQPTLQESQALEQTYNLQGANR